MGLIESLGAAVKLAQNLNNVPLLKALSDAQMEVLGLQEDNRALREKLLELREALVNRGTMIYQRGAYWQQDEDGTKHGPMCTGCWDSEKKIIRLAQLMGDNWRCPVCKSVAKLPGVDSH